MRKSAKVKPLRRIKYYIALVMTGGLFTCNADFKDSSMSLLKKPEILSIVIEPPEAAPGESVKASFLVADQYGVIDDAMVLWLPDIEFNSRLVGRRSNMKTSVTKLSELDEEVKQPIAQIKLDDATRYEYDQEGFANHYIGLMAFMDEKDVLDMDINNMEENLNALLWRDGAIMAIRTLMVSNRKEQNRNPRVAEIFWGKNESKQKDSVSLVRSSIENIDVIRMEAMARPVEIIQKEKLYFRIQVEDDDPVKAAIRYQWIATGGDFGEVRRKIQPWEAPEYIDGQPQLPDPKQNIPKNNDPNLYTLWVILRDNGIRNRTGQGWAEFYVRILPE